MGAPARSEVVLVSFPFSDLSQSKLRPAVVLAKAEYGDLVLCQITSKTYGDRNAVELNDADFESGSLKLTSYARPGRLFTADDKLIRRTVGRLRSDKLDEVVEAVTKLLRDPN